MLRQVKICWSPFAILKAPIMPIIGIDLGTSNSAAAALRGSSFQASKASPWVARHFQAMSRWPPTGKCLSASPPADR